MRPSSRSADGCAVAISFDADHETIPLRDGDESPMRISQGQYGTRSATPRIRALLQREAIPATFFYPAVSALLHPDEVRGIAGEGHEIGIHSWIHEANTTLPREAERELSFRAAETLTKLAGRAPTLCRPPYGRIDSIGLALCAGLRYGVTLWSEHVTGSNPRGDVDLVLRQASPGSIVLAHDGGSEPNASLMEQLDRLVASMTDTGYRFVTVSELLATSA